MEGNAELLRQEMTEIHSFARHHFQLYMTWYTFFLTVNFAAIGWFTSVLLTGALKVSLPIVFVAAFFVVQLIFSYIASLRVSSYFQEAYNRCEEILGLLATEASSTKMLPQSAIPAPIYSKLIALMCSTLVSFVFFWVALTAVAIHIVPL
jgi:hypothetical protein